MFPFAPLDAAVGVAVPAVAALAPALVPIAGPAAGAAAIVLSTVGIRLLTAPLTYARVSGQRRQARLAPQIAELRRRYGADPARLATELAALGVSPLAGCLPTLLQAPFFVVAFRMFSTGTVGADPNPLLSGRLFGVPLDHHLVDGVTGGALPVYGGLLLVAVSLAWWLSRRLRTSTSAALPDAAGGPTVAGRHPAGRPGDRRRSVRRRADAAASDPTVSVRRLLPLLPYTALLALPMVPLAAALHLVTTTACTVLEQVVFRHPAPPVG